MGKAYLVDSEVGNLRNHPDTGFLEPIELAFIPIELHEVRSFIGKLSEDYTIQHLLEEVVSLGESTRYRPSLPMDKRCTAIHGINYKDLLHEKKSSEFTIPKDMLYLIAHNTSFDLRAIQKPAHVKPICTLALSRLLDKKYGIGLGSHKLDNTLNHFYGEDVKFLTTGYHRALEDNVKTLLLLGKLLEYVPAITTFEELYTFTESLKPAKRPKKA